WYRGMQLRSRAHLFNGYVLALRRRQHARQVQNGLVFHAHEQPSIGKGVPNQPCARHSANALPNISGNRGLSLGCDCRFRHICPLHLDNCNLLHPGFQGTRVPHRGIQCARGRATPKFGQAYGETQDLTPVFCVTSVFCDPGFLVAVLKQAETGAAPAESGRAAKLDETDGRSLANWDWIDAVDRLPAGEAA
ncbi:MAG: hypothetical protein ABIR56_07610, partial [Polaromonas sp.]